MKTLSNLLLLVLGLLGSGVAFGQHSMTAQPVYKVAPNGTYPDRPAYEIVQPTGPQVGKQVGRVNVGEPCDCAEPIKKGSTTYCPVAAEPAKLAVCKAYPPPDPVMYSGVGANLEGALPVASQGTDQVQVKDTTEAPAPTTDGAFRAACGFVGYRYDDPIVHPGKPGVSHLHTVVGNSTFSASSTLESLLAGKGTCRGGAANLSAYWVTTLIDMRTLKPVAFEDWFTYYKASRFDQALGYGWKGTDGVWHPSLKPDGTPRFPGFSEVPNGLRIVAGDPMAMAPQTSGPQTARWTCNGGGLPNVSSQVIPDCAVGQKLIQEVFFPQCWDGVNLDSPDHKSHMAYPVQVKNEGDPRATGRHPECPASHPVVLPGISFSIRFPVTEAGQTKNWRLSADSDMTLPAGMRNHGDAFIAWNPTVKAMWHRNCIKASAECQAHLLGEGKALGTP